jgi:hypothetical protein
MAIDGSDRRTADRENGCEESAKEKGAKKVKPT